MKVSTKFWGIIAMVLAVISLLLNLAGLIFAPIEVTNVPEGVGRSFRLWIYSVIVALLSLPFFAIDGILAIKRAIADDDRTFNIILSVLLFGSIPMLFLVGCRGDLLCGVIWTIYYLGMLAMEVVSMIRRKIWSI